MDDQCSVKAEVAAARQVAGTARARQRASKRTKLAASLLQRPPTSSAMTVSLQRWAIASYAAGHDDAIWHTLLDGLGGEAGAPPRDAHFARASAFLPAALGGLGPQSATRSAPAASGGFLGSLGKRLGSHGGQASGFCGALHRNTPTRRGRHGCLRQAADARTLLLKKKPQRPDPAAEPQLGDWPHRWQQHASRTRNLYFRDRVPLPSLPPARRALLRSQSGPHAGGLSAIPGDAMMTLPPQTMQVALRRRLRLPLQLAAGQCGPSPGCGGPMDALGDHALACPRSGLLAGIALARLTALSKPKWCRARHSDRRRVLVSRAVVKNSAPKKNTFDRATRPY